MYHLLSVSDVGDNAVQKSLKSLDVFRARYNNTFLHGSCILYSLSLSNQTIFIDHYARNMIMCMIFAPLYMIWFCTRLGNTICNLILKISRFTQIRTFANDSYYAYLITFRECFCWKVPILPGSVKFKTDRATFGATFNLVTCVGLP